MHNNWGYGMDNNGGWWWLAMALMMIVLVGGIIAVAVALVRRGNHPPQPTQPATPPATSATKPTARDILDERFARGEIEADDYRQRVETLTGTSSR
jgi:putative membrane protein